jgi:hypothetical protein
MSKLWSNNPSLPPPSKAFSGETYKPERDFVRLSGQLGRVFDVMKDGRWRTLTQIANQIYYSRTGHLDTEAAISARLRDLRKEAHGGHTVERRYVANGLHEYRLIVKGRQAA